MWDFYEPLQKVDIDVHEGRPIPASFAGLLFDYLLLPAAVAGVFDMRHRQITVGPMLMPTTLVTVVDAMGFGMVSFRAEAEASLVVLAAIRASAVWRRLGAPRAPLRDRLSRRTT